MVDVPSSATEAQGAPTNEDVEVFHHSADELEVVDSAQEARYTIPSSGVVPDSTAATTQTLLQQLSGHS